MRTFSKSLVLVVCGYRCLLDTPLGCVYLPRVVRFIEELERLPHTVFLCGGQTQKRTTGPVSEAEVMHKFLSGELGDDPPIPFELEKDSYTTLDNIRNVSQRLARRVPSGSLRIVIFCEATKSASVVMLARHFFVNTNRVVESIDDITVETASWERADPFKQVRHLVLNKLAIKFPWLGLAEMEHRRRVLRSHFV